MTTGYPGLSVTASTREIAERVNRILQGKLNAVMPSVTLTANADTTTLTDTRIGGATWFGFMPLTENAAAALASIYVTDRLVGSATVNHANTADTDCTFDVLLVG